MDAQLKELIEKIKSDGVKSAGDEAARIIADAEKKAAEIIANAKRVGEDTVSKAESDAARFRGQWQGCPQTGGKEFAD
jgi:V/A-type H+-transporting ATPase subunit E